MVSLTESYDDYYVGTYGCLQGLLSIKAGYSGLGNIYNSPTIAPKPGITDKSKVKNNLKLLLL